jgi:replicative DNA helicase
MIPDNPTREFPHAVGPEKSVLSTILQDPRDYIPIAVEEGLNADHFYFPGRAELFRFIVGLHTDGIEIELISLVQQLLDNGLLDRVGGPSAIHDIYCYAPSPTYFRQHVQILRDKAILRDIINLGSEAVECAYDSPGEAAEVLADVERKVTAIAARAAGGVPSPSLGGILRESLEGFESRVRGDQDGIGIPTGTILDRHLRGLHPGRVYVFCAYPKGGKSVLASQIIIESAIDGVPAMFITMEMSEREIMDRMIIQAARMPAEAFTSPRDYAERYGAESTTNATVQSVRRSVEKIAVSKLVVRRAGNRDISAITSMVRKAHREKGIKVAAIDFAQLIKCKGKTGVEEVEAVSHAIHGLAQELQIAIILPSQLNADGDTKNGRVFEEDAAAVVNIVQDRNKESSTYNQHRYMLIVADRFYGSGGERVPLILDRERIRFTEGQDETATNSKPSFKR